MRKRNENASVWDAESSRTHDVLQMMTNHTIAKFHRTLAHNQKNLHWPNIMLPEIALTMMIQNK